jgi:hypothetical protein
MASRKQRTLSSHELLSNVRRARRFTERYEIDHSNPAEFMNQTTEQQAGWDNLLSQIK